MNTRRSWYDAHRECHHCGRRDPRCYRETMRNGVTRPVLVCGCGRVVAYVPKRFMRVEMDALPPKPTRREACN